MSGRIPGLLLGAGAVLLAPHGRAAAAPASPANPAAAVAPAAKAAAPGWVERSNQNARLLLDVMARFTPESAGELGLDGYDEQTLDLSPGWSDRYRGALREAAGELRRRQAGERDPHVAQDLEILVGAADDAITGQQLDEKYEVPYFDVPQIVFSGVRALLDDQVDKARRPAALARVRRYAGLAPGTTPLTQLAAARFRERLARPGLLGPPRAQVEKDLADGGFYVDGIAELFKKYGLADDGALAALRAQLQDYVAFTRREVLPRARDGFRLPAERYAFALKQVGVDVPPDALAAQAHAAFTDIQRQMAQLAQVVAKQKGYPAGVTDYREVIARLKREQLVGADILPLYRQRLADLEGIIRAQHLLTLPSRAARIRLASPAESARTPAPSMHAPRLLNNTGELGEFVLPLRVPGKGGGDDKTAQLDDFTFAAASWTLTAHEARPGHELQFASLVERGVSVARVVFAFNSTNAEGWGLYAESIAMPFMPPEGQLISLQHRLMRAARAFLDPELQAGITTPAQAREFLRRELVLSPAMAEQEVERYTFRAPGQATSYYYGYSRLVALRAEVEAALGPRFVPGRFHDFVLAQGLLPPALLRRAVLSEFVPQSGGGEGGGAKDAAPAPR